MIYFLFLDTYNVSSADDLRDWYAVLKDIVVPALAIIFSITGAIIAVNWQHKLEKARNADLERKQKKMEFEMLKLNIQKMVTNMENAEEKMHETINNLSLEKYMDVYVAKYSSTFHLAITSLGYQKIFEFIDKDNEAERESFATFWLAVSSIPDNYVDIYQYMIYINNEYNKLNSFLNDINHSLSLTVVQNIHNVFEPYTGYHLTKEQVATDPEIRLAVLSKQIVDEFKREDDNKIFVLKIKDFLWGIKRLSKDPIAAKKSTDEFFQDTERAFSYLTSMESVLKAGKETIISYRDKIKRDRGTIEKFSDILSKKSI